MKKQQITILGATGSVGQSTIAVLSAYPERYQVFAVTANKDVTAMLTLCQQVKPRYAVMADIESAKQLEARLGSVLGVTVLSGAEQLAWVASHTDVDMVMTAIVGAAGLLSTLAAAEAGKRVMLANKESLIMAGPLLIKAAQISGAILLPVDSEHSAIYQCLPTGTRLPCTADLFKQIIITASGGPFRDTPLAELAAVTPAQAVAHPTWNMGAKISVDSATMFNKGLEVIEACFLFGLTAADWGEKLQVVIQPESLMHSLVAYQDGSMLAQLGQNDMQIPISYCLAWPERLALPYEPLDLVQLGSLQFREIDMQRYPCFELALQALQAGQSAVIVANAANEVAVSKFLSNELSFPAIAATIQFCLSEHNICNINCLDDVITTDRWARDAAEYYCIKHSKPL